MSSSIQGSVSSPVSGQVSEFSSQEFIRFARQIVVPEFGLKGQLALRNARVLVVGTGGLSSPVLMYLAACGVGTLGIIEDDVVSLSNIHRQLLHSENSIGDHKLNSAVARIKELNSLVEVVSFRQRLNSANALEVASGFDVIVDGSDNFPTRYLVSDLAVKLQIPAVFASVLRFEGQFFVYDPSDPVSSCFRCLYPSPPPPGLVPSCAEGGVFGALAGMFGSLQALEVVKIVSKTGSLFSSSLLVFDGFSAQVKTLPARRDPSCAVCSLPASEVSLIDYEEFCSMPASDVSDANLQLDLDAFVQRLESSGALLVDVREKFETDLLSLPSALLVPLPGLPEFLETLDSSKSVLFFCQSGVRSLSAALYASRQGFDAVSFNGNFEDLARKFNLI